jgi:hypothetical protein
MRIIAAKGEKADQLLGGVFSQEDETILRNGMLLAACSERSVSSNKA